MMINTDKNDPVTVINVFTVENPEQQQQIVDFLVENVEIPKKLPGFISATLHKSLDGKRVVNYVQWRNQEALEAAIKEPDFIPVAKQAGDFSTHDFHFYKVVFTARNGSD